MHSLWGNSLNACKFLIRNQRSQGKWQNIFKVLKEKNYQPSILYALKMSFRHGGEIKTSSAEGKLRECTANTPASK